MPRLKLPHHLLFLLFLFTTLSITSSPFAGESIQIQGSTTVLPIAEKAAAAYMKAHPNVNIKVEGSGSGHGIKALIDGTTDIASASRFIKSKEAKMAYEKGSMPVPFRIAYDCIIPVVNKQNSLSDITMNDLKNLYSGKIKNWKELGGEDAPITVYSRDTSSGTYGVWNKMVMNKTDMTPAAHLKPSNSEIADIIAKSPNAIGYIGIGHLNKTIKALSVNGIKGSESNAVNGSYPITRPLYLFTSGWPTGEIKQFINFMLEPSLGQRYVKHAGYLSVYLPTASKNTPCPQCPPCPDCPEVTPCPPQKSCPECDPEKVENAKTSQAKKSSEINFNAMSYQQRVRLFQTYLTKLGYKIGRIDGIWGERSANAYKAFQKNHGLKPVVEALIYPVLQKMEQTVQ